MILVWGEKRKEWKTAFPPGPFLFMLLVIVLLFVETTADLKTSSLWQRLKRQILRIELFKSAGVMSIWPYVIMRALVRWILLGDLVWLFLCVAEPEGVFPPEVVVLNSTAVRVLWTAPLVPNGAVTQYSVYLDGRLYESASNGTGSLEVGGLLPFTVHSIQVWPSIQTQIHYFI